MTAATSTTASAEDADTRTLGLLLFNDFEVLDACEPLEVWGNLKSKVRVVTAAVTDGPVASAPGPALIAEFDYASCPRLDMLLVPGGAGAFYILKDQPTLEFLRERFADSKLTISVCNGFSPSAAAGMLDGRPAATNKAYRKQSTLPAPT